MPRAINETTVRRLAACQGSRLIKSRFRTPESPSYVGYMPADLRTNIGVAGASPLPYSLSLESAGWLQTPVEIT